MTDTASPVVRVGVISDTHGKLDPRAFDLFADVNHIIHAGDIGDEDLIWQLEDLAPVIAVRGNVDAPTMCFPNERMAVIGGRTFYVRHQFATVEKLSEAQKRIIEQRIPEVVVFGHTHKFYVGYWRGTLLFNPGGAGAKRFNLPRSIGLLDIHEDHISSRIIDLETGALLQ
ncbi:MAG: metallophosphoesterase family protein [Pyrinomonadaceae bacterium]